ncbi:MAG: amidohydrolase [Rhodobacteraceae bacterium]|nr:amidohydrolase [Paracoccaceae bacterium]
MTVIDADTHVVEGPAIWDFVRPEDEAFRPLSVTSERESRHAYSSGGREFWMIDGFLYGRGGQPSAVYAEGTRDLGNTAARVADMDRYGHDVQVIYPSLFLNLWTRTVAAERAATRAYNAWMAETCRPTKGRLRWVALPVVRDIESSLVELKTAKENGACGIQLRGYEGDVTLDDPSVEPLFAAACDLDMPICIHIGNGSPAYASIKNARTGLRNVLGNSMPTLIAFAALTLAQVPKKFPKLRIGFIEAASEWVPFAVHRCRKALKHYGISDSTDKLFADNRFFVTCEAQEDVAAVARVTGPDALLVGTDYGHADTSTELEAPRLLKERSGNNGDLDHELVRRICDDNPRRFYGL